MPLKKDNTSIEVPRIDVRMTEITLVGDTPLIVHAWSAKAKKEMLDKQMKRPKQAKTAKDPKKDFEDSLYKLPDGCFGFPSVAFKTAAATAALSVDGIKKAEVFRAFHVLGEDIDIEGAFPGTMMRQNLVRIHGTKPRMREDMVRVGMGTADLRYRPEFADWHVRVLVKYNASALSLEQIVNLFNVAGFGVGVGEWRSEKKGQNGLFHVATEADLALIEADEAAADKVLEDA